MADRRQAIQLEPENSEAYLRLADVKAMSTPVDYPSALETCAKFIELDPKDGSAYSNRGVARHALNDYSGGLADYNRAIEWSPLRCSPTATAAKHCFCSGNPSSPVPVSARAVRSNPASSRCPGILTPPTSRPVAETASSAPGSNTQG
jgi:tetratricopeptide (TPR) repeat protein